jgi:hypothetical protein
MQKAPILLTDEIPAPPALVRIAIEMLPASIGAENERTQHRFIEFFTPISATAIRAEHMPVQLSSSLTGVKTGGYGLSASIL